MLAAVIILTTPPLLVGGALLWIYLNQARLLFAPRKEQSPLEASLVKQAQCFYLTTSDGESLDAWYFPPPEKEQPIILFFHGNGGNLASCQNTVHKFLSLGVGFLLFDYRGYGNSSGTPSEEGLHKDAVTAWNWLTREEGIPADRIILYGRSLGATVAARLSAKEAFAAAGIIMESGFSHLGAMREHLYPFFPARLTKFTFDSRPWVQQRRSPLLIAHSKQERYIPYAQARELYSLAAEPKRLFPLKGGHAKGWDESWPEYSKALNEFLQKSVSGNKD